MPAIRWSRRLLAALLLVSVLPAPALAENQSLKLPTMVAGVAASADWASTYYGLTRFHLREVNPLLQPLESSPGQMVAVGALMDGVAFSAWNLTMGQKHPRVAAAGMWAMAAFRGYLAFHNIRNTRKALRRDR